MLLRGLQRFRGIGVVSFATAIGAFFVQSTASQVQAETKKEKKHVVIVGGGSGGLTAAAQLKGKLKDEVDIEIIDPSNTHYYQPLWTMVGGGMFSKKDSAKPMKDVIPKNCSWVQDSVVTFQPEENSIKLASGKTVNYDYLLVAAGLTVRFDAIKGLPEAIGKKGVCSIYDYNQCEYVWQAIKETKSGNAIFTSPPGAVKCGGAPQKIMYLAEDYFRDCGLRASQNPLVKVIFTPAGASMFGIPFYANALNNLRKSKEIEAEFLHNLVEVRGEQKQAVFRVTSGEGQVSEKVMDYSLLHVVPPMSAPDFIRNSPIVDATGYVDVHKETTQHNKYPNIFSIGDCSNLPTSKTAAAIASQAPVCVANMQSAMKNEPLKAKYDGYASCPLITGKNSLMLLEFKYGGELAHSFPGDPAVPRYAYFLMKKYFFPWAYWHLMLNGKWYGRHHIFEPKQW